MSDTKSPLYALSKDTTNSLNSMLDNKHAHVLDTNRHWFINYQPFNQQVVILYPQTFVRSACSSICLCAYRKLCPRPYVFFNMKTLYIRQNEDQGQSSNEWLLPKVMFSFIYVYSSLQQRYFDIFYLFRTPFSVSKYKCVQMDAT